MGLTIYMRNRNPDGSLPDPEGKVQNTFSFLNELSEIKRKTRYALMVVDQVFFYSNQLVIDENMINSTDYYCQIVSNQGKISFLGDGSQDNILTTFSIMSNLYRLNYNLLPASFGVEISDIKNKKFIIDLESVTDTFTLFFQDITGKVSSPLNNLYVINLKVNIEPL